MSKGLTIPAAWLINCTLHRSGMRSGGIGNIVLKKTMERQEEVSCFRVPKPAVPGGIEQPTFWSSNTYEREQNQVNKQWVMLPLSYTGEPVDQSRTRSILVRNDPVTMPEYECEIDPVVKIHIPQRISDPRMKTNHAILVRVLSHLSYADTSNGVRTFQLKINGYLSKLRKQTAFTPVTFWQFDIQSNSFPWINQYLVVRTHGHERFGSDTSRERIRALGTVFVRFVIHAKVRKADLIGYNIKKIRSNQDRTELNIMH